MRVHGDGRFQAERGIARGRWGRAMKGFGAGLLATVGMVGLAQASEAPVEAAGPDKPNCWASVPSWLNASKDDCPIGAYGLTLYGTLDVGYGYQEWGTAPGPASYKSNYGLSKSSHEHIWQPAYNGLSISTLGLKMKEDVLPYGWSLIGVAEAGFNPLSGELTNGPRSLANNNLASANGVSTVTINGKKLAIYNAWQTTNFDTSRAGQWDNGQGFVGVSNKTWGALTFGRTNSLSYDSQAKYDPVASQAFSLIGTPSFAGFGTTELARINTGLTYRVSIPNVGALDSLRLAGQFQIGGYGMGNGSNGAYYAQTGFDWGKLSFDGVVGWAKDAVQLATFGGGVTTCGLDYREILVDNACYDPNNILKATLSNNVGTELMASYKWDRFKFYGGYIYARLMNPSDGELTGFETIASGIFVPAGYWSKGVYANSAVTSNGYTFNKILQTVWLGVRWSIRDDLDLAAGFYHQGQNDYNFSVSATGAAAPAACTGTGAFISSNKCAGSQDAISFLADYKPVKRIDLYAGVMVSNVYGGLANGYWNYQWYENPLTKTVVTTQHAFTQNVAPTAGLRIRF